MPDCGAQGGWHAKAALGRREIGRSRDSGGRAADVGRRRVGGHDATRRGGRPARDQAGRPASAANVTWHNLNLINGWQTASGSGSPMYAISNGVVYLTGGLTQPSPGNEEFAVLPKAARPSHAMYRSITGFAGIEVTLFILPDGVMQVFSSSTSTAQQFSSLTGVSYPVAGTTWHKQSLINGWVSANTPSGDTGNP